MEMKREKNKPVKDTVVNFVKITIQPPFWASWVCPKCKANHIEQVYADKRVCKHQCSWCGESFDCVIKLKES